MIVKEIISEEILTLSEVKEILSNIKEERKDEETELKYEFRKAMAHAEAFSKLDAKSSRELVNELMKLEKIRIEIAVRIADILPLSYDEIRAIYAKERYVLDTQDLKEILDIVLKYA